MIKSEACEKCLRNICKSFRLKSNAHLKKFNLKTTKKIQDHMESE